MRYLGRLFASRELTRSFSARTQVLEGQWVLRQFVAKHLIRVLTNHPLGDAGGDGFRLFDFSFVLLFHACSFSELSLNIGPLAPVATGEIKEKCAAYARC